MLQSKNFISFELQAALSIQMGREDGADPNIEFVAEPVKRTAAKELKKP